jgi:hypothetical protein
MHDNIDAWATRLAEVAVPDEVDLAADLAVAYVAGGKDRAELFRVSAAVPGGFDAGAVLVVFPFILSAITASGTVIMKLLSSGVANVPGAIKDALDLWDRYEQHRNGPTVTVPPGTEQAYRALGRVCEIFEAELAGAGIEPERREQITYRTVRQLLDDQEGTHEFLNAVTPAARR